MKKDEGSTYERRTTFILHTFYSRLVRNLLAFGVATCSPFFYPFLYD